MVISSEIAENIRLNYMIKIKTEISYLISILLFNNSMTMISIRTIPTCTYRMHLISCTLIVSISLIKKLHKKSRWKSVKIFLSIRRRNNITAGAQSYFWLISSWIFRPKLHCKSSLISIRRDKIFKDDWIYLNINWSLKKVKSQKYWIISFQSV